MSVHSEEIPIGGSQVDISSETVDENAPTLLIVEANKINQDSLSRLWQHIGVHAQLADNGFEALALCRERKLDLILMDLSMPAKTASIHPARF